MRRGLICGSPRSATTILSHMLNEHPDVICTSELGIYFANHRCMDGWMLARKLAVDEFHDETGLWKKIRFRIPEEITTGTVLPLLSARVYMDKYPLYTLNLSYATRYTDFAIFCIRDPREVMESQIRRWKLAVEEEHMSVDDVRKVIPWARPGVEEAMSWKPTWMEYAEQWEEWKSTTTQDWLEVKYWEFPGNASKVATFLGLPQDSLDASFRRLWDNRPVVWPENIPEVSLPGQWVDYLRSKGCPTV